MLHSCMRINKYLAEAGVASRARPIGWSRPEKSTINGRKPGPGDQVEEGDEVKVNGTVVRPVAKKTVIAFHKPVGVINHDGCRFP